MGFDKDLESLMKKYGLKADGDEPVESEEEKEPVEEPVEGGEESSPEVVTDIAEKIAKKLTDAIAANKGYGDEDKKSLNRHIDSELKTKIFTHWGGMKEISYPSDLKSLTKEEKIVNFFKALLYSKADPASQQVLRALVEGTDSEGGYLVPEELRTEVYRLLPDFTVMRNVARVLPMSTDTLKLNTLTARPVAYWTSEYASKSTTSADFGQVSLSPNDLVCLIPISEQLLADANINLVQFIVELFTEAIGLGEDAAFFTGSGTGQPRGISQETISTVTAGGNLTFTHILQLIDSVSARVANSPRAAFIGNRNVKSLLRQIKDSNGNYIWRDGGTAPGGGTESRRLPVTLYGYQFYEQNDIAQGTLYFGDWSYYVIGDRQTISVRTTTEGGDAWRRNAMEIKAVERVDGRALLVGAFAKITGA